MNRDEIIRMAREAHGPITGQWWDMDAAALERFYRAAFAAGAAAKREACAKVCDEIAQQDETGYGIAEDCAAAIRAALAQAEPVQEPFALPCPTPKACKAHCCHGACLPAPQRAEPVQPVAWMFELARNFNLEGYGGWEKRITEYRPNTPEGSVRNVTPLYTAPPQQAEPDHETRAELAEQQVVQLAEERNHYRRLWQKAQQAERDALRSLINNVLRCRYPVCTTICSSGYGWDIPRLNEVIDAAKGGCND